MISFRNIPIVYEINRKKNNSMIIFSAYISKFERNLFFIVFIFIMRPFRLFLFDIIMEINIKQECYRKLK